MNNVVNKGNAVVQITGDGQVVSWELDVSSNVAINDLSVKFDIPDGIELTGPNDGVMPVINLDRGAYNPLKNTWFIGKIEKDETISQVFEFTLKDMTKLNVQPTGEFVIYATAKTALTETTLSDNMASLTLRLGPACEDLKLRIGTGDEDKSTNISIS